LHGDAEDVLSVGVRTEPGQGRGHPRRGVRPATQDRRPQRVSCTPFFHPRLPGAAGSAAWR